MCNSEQTHTEWLQAQHHAEQTAHQGAGFGTLHERLKAGKAGLDVLAGMIDGTLPVPLACVKDRLFLVSADPGAAVMQAVPGLDCLNPSGTVEGGWIFKVADLTMGSAVLSVLPADYGYATVKILDFDFVRNLHEGTIVRGASYLKLVPETFSPTWFKTQRRPHIEASVVLYDCNNDVYATGVALFRVFKTGVADAAATT